MWKLVFSCFRVSRFRPSNLGLFTEFLSNGCAGEKKKKRKIILGGSFRSPGAGPDAPRARLFEQGRFLFAAWLNFILGMALLEVEALPPWARALGLALEAQGFFDPAAPVNSVRCNRYHGAHCGIHPHCDGPIYVPWLHFRGQSIRIRISIW